MRWRFVSALAVLFALGCSRDLEVPTVSLVTVAPAVAEVAPRERLTLAASGGAGGFSFAFAPGGKLSGDDAAVDAATGQYQAGALGSAQDVVEVTDRNGRKATARITVRQRLALTPALAGTAPGGEVLLVASGGKPPYVYSIPTNGSGAPFPFSAVGRYRAGSTGDVVDVVRITDATADPAAFADAEIHVGTQLKLYATAQVVAPFDSATVVAMGGQPPYTLTVSTDASGGAAISSISGLYTAGGSGGVDDVVTVEDANHRTATLAIHVGPTLTLQYEGIAPDLRPGVPVQLKASGGKPPYAYRFAARGSRSGGSVDGTTGLYTPGYNTGAIDEIEVTDQTGVAVAPITPAPLPVGPRQYEVGSGMRVCAVGDLDGDGGQDLVLVSDYFARLSTVLGMATEHPTHREYALSYAGDTDVVAVADLDGDGRDEVIFSSWGEGIHVLSPDMLGTLAPAPELAINGVPTRTPLYASVGSSRYVFSDYGCGTEAFYAYQYVPRTYPNKPYFALTCFTAPGWGYGPSNVIASAMADVDGDGYPDLVQLRNNDGSDVADPSLYVSYGMGSGGTLGWFGARTAVAPGTFIPAGHRFSTNSDFGVRRLRLVAVPARPGVGRGGVLVRIEETATGRGKLLSASDNGARAWTVNPAYDPVPGSYGPHGVALVPASVSGTAAHRAVAWNAMDGRLDGVQLDLVTLAPSPSSVAARNAPSRVDCVSIVDANRDGIADLAAVGQFTSAAEVQLGSALQPAATTPAFGDPERVFYQRLGYPAVSADFDGDGLVDLVTWDGSSLASWFGGKGQLALGQRLSTVTPLGMAVAPFFGAAPSVIFHDMAQGFYAAVGNGDGTFQPVVGMDARDALGNAYTNTVWGFSAARLGAPALVAGGAVFLVQDATHLLVVPMSTTNFPAYSTSEDCAFVAGGDYAPGATTAEVLAGCAVPRISNGNARDFYAYRSTLSGIGGSNPTFGPWTEIASARFANPQDESIFVSGALIGNPQLADGKPWFAYTRPTLNQVAVVQFDPSNGHAATTDVLAWPLPLGAKGDMAVIQPLKLRGPAQPSDLVLGGGSTVILRANAGHYSIAQVASGAGIPLGAGKLSSTPGALPWLLRSGANLFSTTPSSVAPVPLDASGLLR